MLLKMDFRILSIILLLRSEVDCVVVAMSSPQNHTISLKTSSMLSVLRQFPLTEQLAEQIIPDLATVTNVRLIAASLREASDNLLPLKFFFFPEFDKDDVVDEEDEDDE